MKRFLLLLPALMLLAAPLCALDAEQLSYPLNTVVPMKYTYSNKFQDKDGDSWSASVELDFSFEIVDSYSSDCTLLPMTVRLIIEDLKLDYKTQSLSYPEENSQISFDTSKLGNKKVERRFLDALRQPIEASVWWDKSLYACERELIPSDELWDLAEHRSMELPSLELLDDTLNEIVAAVFALAEVNIGIGETGLLNLEDAGIFTAFDDDYLLFARISNVTSSQVIAKPAWEPRYVEDDYQSTRQEISGTMSWNLENPLKLNHQIRSIERDYDEIYEQRMQLRSK